MYVINGVIFGLLLSVLVGPVFFTLLQTSIQYGFKRALLVAVGVSLGDILYIGLAYFGLAKFLQNSGIQEYLGYGGGSILILFGIFNILKKAKVYSSTLNGSHDKGIYRFVIRGMLINGLSPFVLIFWLGTMSLATIEYAYTGYKLLLFFLAILVVVFSTDCLKAFLANRLRTLITMRLMKLINVLVGLVLIGFGLRMVFYSW
ncbi:MAG: LysE family transporter [Bacteroidota bacterium]